LGDTVSVGWAHAYSLIVRQRVGVLLRNTGILTFCGMASSAVLGTSLAWIIERTNLPGRRIWNVLLAAPLAIPAFVTSFGWVSISDRVENLGGALLVVTLAYYPLVYLPVAATLRGLDPAFEETARSLGQREASIFFRVVLPQLRPALLGGSLLVGLHLLSEFGALQLLRFETFTTAIYDEYTSSFSGPSASSLASVLLFLCSILLIGELRLRGSRRYARVGGGAARSITPRSLGWETIPMTLAVAGVVVLALGVPLGSIIRWLAVGSTDRFSSADLSSTAVTTILLGLGGALVTTLVALPVAILAVRYRGPVTSTLERTTYFSNALPGIVVALALVSVSLRWFEPVYQTTALLLAAYALLFLPRAMISLRAAIAQAPPLYDDVAHGLGAGPLETMRRVTLPLIARGLGASAAMVFLGIVTELTATLLLSPIGTTTLSTEFWAQSSQVEYGAAAPYAALMVAISMPATFLLSRDARRVSP
jgi:iron(III) transport system permease protein